MSAALLACVLAAASLLAPLGAQGLEELDRVIRVSAVERPGHHYASLSGRLLDPNGKALVGAQVILMVSHEDFLGGWPLGRALSDEKGDFRIDDITGKGEARLWVLTPKGKAWQRAGRPVKLIDGRVVDLGSWRPFEDLVTAPADQKVRVVSGLLVDAKGLPVTLAFLRLEESGDSFDPGAYSYTDAKGAFRIVSRLPVTGGMSVFAGWHRFWIDHDPTQKKIGPSEDGVPGTLAIALRENMRLELDELQACPLPKAKDGQEPWSYRLHFAGRIRECGSSRIWLMDYDDGSSQETLVSRAGSLPRPLGYSWSPKSHVTVNYPSFSKSVRYSLQFEDLPAKLLAQVRLDIDLLRGERETETIALGRFALDAQGGLRLMGAADAVYEIHAYLEGHEPIQGWWQAGRTLHLRFEARDQQVVFFGAAKGKSLRIKMAGSFQPVAILNVDDKGHALTHLAPGNYEASLYDASDEVISTRGFRLQRKQGKASIDLSKDERPRVRLLLPQRSKGVAETYPWSIQARRGPIGGMVARRALMATLGGRHVRFQEESVQVEEKSTTEYELRFPTSGSYALYCRRRDLWARFFWPLDLQMEDDIIIRCPEMATALEGRMSSFSPPNSATHGVAGPRLLLWPLRNKTKINRMGLFLSLPIRNEDGSFRVDQLPSGNFVLFHHLIGKDVESKDSDGQSTLDNKAVYVWGGISVRLSAKHDTDIGDLDAKGAGTLDVRVTDKQGRPIPFGYLEVLDPLFDSWNEVVKEGTTLRFAQDPIPAPPRARIQLGKARLEKIRKGHLLLRVLLPGGLRVTLERDVVPGKLLKLRLPMSG